MGLNGVTVTCRPFGRAFFLFFFLRPYVVQVWQSVAVNDSIENFDLNLMRAMTVFYAILTPSTKIPAPPNFPVVGTSHFSGFLLYIGQGGMTANAVRIVPANPIHNVRCMSWLMYPTTNATAF